MPQPNPNHSYLGYNPSFQYQSPPPTVVGWSTPTDLDNGFVPPSSYTNADIICHKAATNAGTAAAVKAGGTVVFEWTPWPSSHKGPITDYMANCNGPCETVDKTTLKWFKIDHTSFISGNNPGIWVRSFSYYHFPLFRHIWELRHFSTVIFLTTLL
jgi:cellulase